MQKAEKTLVAMRRLEADPRFMAEPIANQELLVAQLKKKLQEAKPLPARLASAHAKVARHKGVLEECNTGIADLEAKLQAAKAQKLEAQGLLQKAEQELEELRSSWAGGGEVKGNGKEAEDLKEVYHVLRMMKFELVAELPLEKRAAWVTRLDGVKGLCPPEPPRSQDAKRQRVGGGAVVNLEETSGDKPMEVVEVEGLEANQPKVAAQ